MGIACVSYTYLSSIRTGGAIDECGEDTYCSDRRQRSPTGGMLMLSLIRVAASCVLALISAQSAFAQTHWPEKPVKLVVGFTAGSATEYTREMRLAA